MRRGAVRVPFYANERTMGILSVDLFVTLDGVYQATGGPDEDREGGFEFGGWQAAYSDDETGEAIRAGINRMDALLRGRKTYDIQQQKPVRIRASPRQGNAIS